MIVSASRRTDLPSYYSEWFINRIKEEFVYVRNPMNIHQISKISLSSEVIDGIVFWTKNPLPMMDKLHLLDRYMYYFQFTVNSYAQDIEPNVPNKNDIIIPAFRELSRKLGADRVIWRYDPILLTERYGKRCGFSKRYFLVLVACRHLTCTKTECRKMFLSLIAPLTTIRLNRGKRSNRLPYIFAQGQER